MLTSTFNTTSTELENKIKSTDIIAKCAITKTNTIKSDLTDYAKKVDVATNITAIKNDYATNASLISQLNDLKSQHIATEVTAIDNKTKKNASDILALESKLQQKEDTINENERGNSFAGGLFFYIDQSYLVYNCKLGSFDFNVNKISKWKSTGIFNHFSNSKYFTSSGMNAVGDASGHLPDLKNDGRMYVYLSGNHFHQNIVIIPNNNNNNNNNNNVINIYCVYQIGSISSSRDDTFTIQNALFGAMQISKNDDTSKYKHKGYGICFDEGGTFSKGNISNCKNVLIFSVDESSLVHANNKANNIYVMGDLFVQGINDTTLYAEKIYSQNFTQPSKKFILSLHYNGNDSYLFVNGKQELKFKAKTSHLIKEKLFIGNLSDQWTTSESEKTGLYGNIYDLVVDYEQIVGVKAIDDMHRYLMTKHNISP